MLEGLEDLHQSGGVLKRIIGLIICVILFTAASLVGLFALGGQQTVEGSVPIQITDPQGWFVTSFVSARADENWIRPALVEDCGNLSSNPGFGETAKIFVSTRSEDFVLEYPNRGARVIVCAGFTAFFPPASSGIAPRDEP